MENAQEKTHVRNWKNYLIGLLAIGITVLWFARGCDKPAPVVDVRETAYQDTIRALRAQVATIDAKEDSIFSSATDRFKRDSITIKQQDRRIAVARVREREAEAKISELTKQEHPEVVAALAAKDTTIMEMQNKVDSLQASNYISMKQLTALEHLDINEDRIKAQMIQECEARREQMRQDLEVANKKAAKVPILKKVITWLGVALVIETGILALK